MGDTRLYCCCFAPFTPELELSSYLLLMQLTLCLTPVWYKNSCSLAENSSHRLGGHTEGNPAVSKVGTRTSSNLALQCPFPVLQQCLNRLGSLKYLSAAVYHILTQTGSTVSGTFYKRGSSTGLSGDVWTGTWLRKVRTIWSAWVLGPVQESTLAARRMCF